MEDYRKVTKLAEKLNLNTDFGFSYYGTYDKVNLRISDHLPKLSNISEQINNGKFILNNDSEISYLFIIISNDKIDEDEWEEEAEDYITFFTEKKVKVSLCVFEEEDEYDVIETYTMMKINTI